MQDVLQEFESRLQAITAYSHRLREWEQLGAPPVVRNNEEELESRTDKTVAQIGATELREFNYCTLVVLIFTCFEIFIEEIMRRYLRLKIADASRYAELPEKIRNNHETLSVELMSKIAQSRYRNNLTVSDVIRRMYLCEFGAPPIEINEEAFIIHTSNFRPNSLKTYFERVGIESVVDRAIKIGGVAKLVEERGISSTATFILEDLCARRNEVAHGRPASLLEWELISLYIEYIKKFGEDIFTIIYSDYLTNAVQDRGHCLGIAAAIYDSQIACFKDIPISVSRTDLFVVQDTNDVMRAAPILEMQIEGKTCDAVDCIDLRGLAIKTELKVKKNYNCFIIPNRPDHMVADKADEIEDIEDLGLDDNFVPIGDNSA